jgi:isopentenyl diphosphate isomerase/L-lactate dehydrogenase-like FMN-dependent dehydrogenase
MLMVKLEQLVVQQKLNVFILIIGNIQQYQKKTFCKQMANFSFSLSHFYCVFIILGPKFLHIYLTIPNEILEELLREASKKGYRAIVVTCDDPCSRIREFTLPKFLEASNNIDPGILKILSMPNVSILDKNMTPIIENIVITWTNIEKIRKLTKLPIICKGILSPIDAEIAIKYGADGIIVRFVVLQI